MANNSSSRGMIQYQMREKRMKKDQYPQPFKNNQSKRERSQKYGKK